MPGNIKPNRNNMWQVKSAEGLNDPQIIQQVGSSLGTTGTINLDMEALNGSYQVINMTGGVTFTTSNRNVGRTVVVKLVAGASGRALAFPDWTFIGAAAPTTLASGKVGVLSVTFFDDTNTNAVAAFSAQP